MSVCTRGRCGAPAVLKRGTQWLCAKHYRFGQMREDAKRGGKVVPTYEQLDSFLRDTCLDCGLAMHLLCRDGERARQMTLQHYRDGSMAFVCTSCNTRHAYMPGDTYRDMPKDHKRCPQCEAIKPFAAYSVDRGRSGPIKLKSWCKQCTSAALGNWQRNNRDHYNALQRQGRARRAAAR